MQTCTMARMRHVRGSDSGTGGRQRESRTYCRTSCVQFVCANVRYKPLGYPAQTCTMARMRHVRGSDSGTGGRQRESEPIFAPMRVANRSGIRRKPARWRECAMCGVLIRWLRQKRTNRGILCPCLFFLEQATGIEPAASAWEAEVLPLDYACVPAYYIPNRGICQSHSRKSLGFFSFFFAFF